MPCYYEVLKFIWFKIPEEERSKSTVFASGWLCHVSQHVRDTMGLDRTDLWSGSEEEAAGLTPDLCGEGLMQVGKAIFP